MSRQTRIILTKALRTSASLLLLLLLLLYVDRVSAASLGLLDDMQISFKSETEKWFAPLESIARSLLIGLAILSLAWNFLQLVLRNGDFQEIFLVLVKHLLTIGLFLAIIFNAREWTAAILDSFVTAAGAATGKENPDMSAASVLHQGLALGQKITQLGSAWWEPLVLYPLSLIAVLLYAVMAAYMMLVYAETYIVTAGGIILLGFAGTDWTLDYARRYLTYCVSVGAKLYVLYLVIGVGAQMINTWANEQVLSDRSAIIAVIGVLFVMVVLVVTLPNLIQNLINGAALNTSNMTSLGMAATAVTSPGAALVKTAGAGVINESLHSSGGLARSQGPLNSGQPSSSTSVPGARSSSNGLPQGQTALSSGNMAGQTPRLSLADGRLHRPVLETIKPLHRDERE